MRAHIINDGRVVNTIEVDGLDVLPGLIDAALGGQIGDLYDESSGAFTSSSPPVIVPDEVSRRQGLQALFLAGVTEDSVLAFIGTIADDTTRSLALIEFKNATTFRIDNPLVMAAAEHFGLDLDLLFIQANLL